MIRVLKTIVLLVAIFSTTGCDVDVYTEEPERPGNIPEISLWIGGPDGGVFVLVQSPDGQDKDLYYTEIYYASGDAAYKGFMELHPASSGGFDVNKQESYMAWDGDSLYLRDGRYLKLYE